MNAFTGKFFGESRNQWSSSRRSRSSGNFLTVVVVVVVVAVGELSASSVLDSVCTVLRFPVSVPDAGALTFGYIIDSF